MLRRRARPGPVPVTRDVAHAGDTGPLSWTEQARADTSVHDLLVAVNARLPHPDRSRGWVAYVRSPGDRWSWTRTAVAVLRPGEVVVRHPGGTVGGEFAAVNWQASLQLVHRSGDEPDVPDGELLAHVEHSPDRDRR